MQQWGFHMENEISKNLEKLKNNKMRVPLEILKTKYRKSYVQLLQEIKEESIIYIRNYLIGNFEILEKENQEKFLKIFQKIIDEENGKGTFKKISFIIFEEYDIGKAIQVLEEEVLPRMEEAYLPYWYEHCVEKNGKIYNSIINLYWNEYYHLWTNEDCSIYQDTYPPKGKE